MPPAEGPDRGDGSTPDTGRAARGDLELTPEQYAALPAETADALIDHTRINDGMIPAEAKDFEANGLRRELEWLSEPPGDADAASPDDARTSREGADSPSDVTGEKTRELTQGRGFEQGKFADAIRSGIATIIAAAKRPGHNQLKERYGRVSSWLADQAGKVDVDLRGFNGSIDTSAVRHAFIEHGDSDVEVLRGQLPITEEDILSLLGTVAHADKVVFGLKNRRGQDEIATLTKLEDGATLVVKEVRTGRRDMALASMRKYPATMNEASILASLDPNAQGDGGDGLIIVDVPEDVTLIDAFEPNQYDVNSQLEELDQSPESTGDGNRASAQDRVSEQEYENKNESLRDGKTFYGEIAEFVQRAGDIGTDAYSLEAHDAARAFVREFGIADGLEHLIAFDLESGLLFSVGPTYEVGAVAFPPAMQDVWIRGAGARFVVHHNHPGSTALSDADVSILASPVFDTVIAHGHNGNISAARLSDKAPAFLTEKHNGDDLLLYTIDLVYEELFELLGNQINAGEVSAEMARRVVTDYVNRGLATAGIIDYFTSHPAPSTPYLEQALEAAINEAREITTKSKSWEGAGLLDRPAVSIRNEGDLGAVLENSGILHSGEFSREGANTASAKDHRTEKGGRGEAALDPKDSN